MQPNLLACFQFRARAIFVKNWQASLSSGKIRGRRTQPSCRLARWVAAAETMARRSPMEQSEFLAKLADLSRRIDARSEEFEERGEFSDVHRETADRIRRHHDQLRVKVEGAVREGAV